MDSTKVMSLLETLDDEIDDLEESLEPLIKVALSETASKLPLLDKAKLYILVTYAIESMLFSYLRLHGVKARDHPVFKELTRVKQYFDKIKNIENPLERTMAVDRAAAARFIKAGLAGNDKYDLVRAEKIAKERAIAHIKFNEPSKDAEKKRKAGELEAPADEDSSSDSESSPESSEPAEKVSKKKPKLTKKEKAKLNAEGEANREKIDKKAAKKAKKIKMKQKQLAAKAAKREA
ncbi:hypothetical protein MBM_06285 [Drepanopeziza brunnea f. sp. 'multigermtubi' MB_m1]|uniref:Exosome complex protein n=1 Tax=Marssonina brunnea f. sp. multigermtubi (strain MB_m1) TaxID=1072389 RepID=K1WTC3_MARBU|nr:uncharacterized protein MBM_06285 [Drepanopeziza brunnea f. sp. 'multigermtubi' MB_m1]EKD15657.1 hypothetical protein MBM_06285 [Drepanopeziza brunnea f. sp. 'multigermtubi' MB_m1]